MQTICKLLYICFSEFAWNVITQTAGEIGTTEVSPPGSPSPGADRKLSEETQEILKGLKERRFTLARMTSVLDDTKARGSIEIDDDENLVPRSRRGSLFPASEFIDDFPEAETANRSRSGSITHDLPLAARKESGSLISGQIANFTIKEVDED